MDSEDAVPQLMRSLSCVSVRKTSSKETESAFSDFVSDGSNSEDEDEDDAVTRALLRMQQQADDRTYVDMFFKVDRPIGLQNGDDNRSFRLTLARPGVVDSSDERSALDGYGGPRRFACADKVVDKVESSRNSESESSEEDERASGTDDQSCFDTRLEGGAVSSDGDNARESLSAMQHRSDVDDSFYSDERSSFSDAPSFSGASFTEVAHADKSGNSPDGSLASRPPSFNAANDDSFYDAGKPSFSDAHSFTNDSFVVADHSFVYRPSLPDDMDTPSGAHEHSHEASSVAKKKHEAVLVSRVNQAEVVERRKYEEESSFLSPSTSSFIRTRDAAATNPDDVDSSFRLSKNQVAAASDSFSSVLTDSYTASGPPKLEDEEANVQIGAVQHSTLSVDQEQLSSLQAVEDKIELPIPSMAKTSIPSLSRHSSVSSTISSHDVSSQPRRTTSARESWRVSSLDFRASKHAFDEELGPLAGHPLSPRTSTTESDVNAYRLTSTSEERGSVASASSDLSSFASFHSQANFFVDDIQQGSFSSERSMSMGSRPSANDSFANVAILGDVMRDQNENALRGSSIAAAYPIATDALDHSYSDLVDTAIGLDRSFSSLIDRTNADQDSRDMNANDSSLSSSLASSAVSLTSASSEELSFVSFNVANPPLEAGPAHAQEVVKRSFVAHPINPDRERVASGPEQVLCGSLVLPRGSDVETMKSPRPPSVAAAAYSSNASSFTSPATILAAIKTRDKRIDTRSEETEAGDIALGALPPLAPPLKINIVPHGRGSLSTSITSANSSARSSTSIEVSPVAPSSMTRSSVTSSTGTADYLDFTGVYRGSANSLNNSRNNGIPATLTETQLDVKPEKPSQVYQGAAKGKILFESSGVRLERSMSDSRMLQRESQLKVEEFFRRTYRKFVGDFDERVSRYPTRTTRSRTTVIQCADDIEEEQRHFSFKGDKVAKIVDLKNLRSGAKKPVSHVQDDVSLSPHVEEKPSRHRPMAMTTVTTSSGTTATTMHSGSDNTSLPLNYLLSPKEAGMQRQQMQGKEKMLIMKAKASTSRGGGFFAVSSGPGGDGVSRFGAVAGRRADNMSLTPTLPRLSASGSSGLSPSAFVMSTSTPNGFGSGSAGLGKSPVGFAGTASGFCWKAESGFDSLKRSGIDVPFNAAESGVSLTHRPTLSDRVQTLSTSLASTLRRFLHGKTNQQQNGNNGVTSPQSQCTAPAALPRDYDHNGFYQSPFKVPGLNKYSQLRRNHLVKNVDHVWVRQWLILAICAVLGLSLGAILVRVVIYDASAFNLSADEVRARQESNGALVFAPAVRWLLLPGHLFLRVWRAVSVPLLFCYVVTALADLVGCAEKSELVLSFRSLGYALLLAVLASTEGVLAMWLTHKFGWFYQGDTTVSTTASTLSNALGVTPLPEGAVGMLCVSDGEYLQRLGHDVFACSNASLALPLYEEISTNTTGVADSGAGVFALQQVTNLLATPSQPTPYYPASLGSVSNMTSSLLSALIPNSLASQFTTEESDTLAPLGGLIVFGLVLGYMCGKRILWLRRESQAAMFASVRPSDPTNDPRKTRHYIMSILMELQLALEWLLVPMERFLAPLGFFSLMLGHVILHHREWRSFVSPMASLVVGVLIVIVLHAVVVLPLVLMKFCSHRRNRRVLVSSARTFLPAFLFAFTTDSVALSAPVSMQCYPRAFTATRSAAQLVTAVTAALVRNARALYLPLLLLWLLESSSSEAVELRSTDYVSVGCLSLLSCFCGGSSRLTLAMARSLWSLSVDNQSANLLPATMPLLVVCDEFLSRIVSVVNVVDHLVLTQLAAQHWDETVVPSTDDAGPVSDALLSPIQL